MPIIYFFIAIFATTIGSITGMGGGVIMKPVLDAVSSFDVQTIGVVSSVTVFAMSVISITKHIKMKTVIDFKFAISLAFGSMIGGISGQSMISYIIQVFNNDNFLFILQNILLSIIVMVSFLYMRNKQKIKSYSLSSTTIFVFTGVALGIISTFLGIGGGPINVSVIVFLFSKSTKNATVCSAITILFSQFSKLSGIALTTGFGIYDLSALPLLVIGGIVGGFLGATINKRFSEEKVENMFNLVQIGVILLALYNGLKAALVYI